MNGVSHVALRVLVVDSWTDAADSLALLLRLSGNEVEVAYDGPSALTAAFANPPDVVVLDLALRGLDGYEVARRLRQAADSRGALLVALTGYSQPPYRERAYQAGFDHFLLKPCDPADLHQLLAARKEGRSVAGVWAANDGGGIGS